MANPQQWDRFSEMLSFWVVVEAVDDDGGIAVREWSGHGSLWQQGTPKYFESIDMFQKNYAYGSIPGYWITYCDNVGEK